MLLTQKGEAQKALQKAESNIQALTKKLNAAEFKADLACPHYVDHLKKETAQLHEQVKFLQKCKTIREEKGVRESQYKAEIAALKDENAKLRRRPAVPTIEVSSPEPDAPQSDMPETPQTAQLEQPQDSQPEEPHVPEPEQLHSPEPEQLKGRQPEQAKEQKLEPPQHEQSPASHDQQPDQAKDQQPQPPQHGESPSPYDQQSEQPQSGQPESVQDAPPQEKQQEQPQQSQPERPEHDQPKSTEAGPPKLPLTDQLEQVSKDNGEAFESHNPRMDGVKTGSTALSSYGAGKSAAINALIDASKRSVTEAQKKPTTADQRKPRAAAGNPVFIQKKQTLRRSTAPNKTASRASGTPTNAKGDNDLPESRDMSQPAPNPLGITNGPTTPTPPVVLPALVTVPKTCPKGHSYFGWGCHVCFPPDEDEEL